MKNLALPLLAAASLLFAACGNSSDASLGEMPEDQVLAFTENTTTTSTLLIAEQPTAQLSEDESEMALFEAAWVCELQRRTFDSPAAMDEALTQKLTDSGLTRADYDTFRGQVNTDRDLRDWILFNYQESCRS